jgi:tRNA pseudouridine32 synthase/23S rRNA pseudouridine746 synthase
MTDRTVSRGMVQHRFVVSEPDIPFHCTILFENEHVLVVDKPHFLATMPRGMWYRQTALIQLRQMTGNQELSPAHRLDRQTAGVVVFVKHREDRGAYQMCFERHQVRKTYECLAPAVPQHPVRSTAHVTDQTSDSISSDHISFPVTIESHICKKVGVLQAFELEIGESTPVNACTRIEVKPQQDVTDSDREAMDRFPGTRVYVLHPQTGKTHQLRVHMNDLGCPIVGDDLYPQICDRKYDDFSSPLRLVARKLEMTDPLSGQKWMFTSHIPL